MPNKGNLLPSSMTQFPFVRKQMCVLPSPCTNAVYLVSFWSPDLQAGILLRT